MAGFTALPCLSQKLPSDGEECVFVSMFTVHLSFHTVAVKLPFTFVFLCHPCLISFYVQNSSASLFYLVLTVPQQFIVLVCKLSNNTEDEKKLSTYTLCPTCSILAVSPVTVTCVAIMEGVACFLSLPKCKVIL